MPAFVVSAEGIEVAVCPGDLEQDACEHYAQIKGYSSEASMSKALGRPADLTAIPLRQALVERIIGNARKSQWGKMLLAYGDVPGTFRYEPVGEDYDKACREAVADPHCAIAFAADNGEFAMIGFPVSNDSTLCLGVITISERFKRDVLVPLQTWMEEVMPEDAGWKREE